MPGHSEVLTLLYAQQYQIFSQDLVPYAKVNKHTHLKGMQICSNYLMSSIYQRIVLNQLLIC